MRRTISLALVAGAVASELSSDCTGEQCRGHPSTAANTLLQISKDAKLTKTVSEEAAETEREDAEVPASGAAWTEEEALLVKGKIMFSIENPDDMASIPIFNDYECKSGPGFTQECNDQDNEFCHVSICRVDNQPELSNLFAKYLRLSFHTCLKYEDGTGGCNGCMWFGDMFGKFVQLHGDQNQIHGTRLRQYDDNEEDAKNNGLSGPADILEEIYTNKDFPTGAWPLEKSLKESGKSRADLWAFAGLVAVEYAMTQNNLKCKGEGEKPDCEHNFQHIPITYPCEITLTRAPSFLTGRRDCADSDKPTDPETSSKIPHRARDYESTRREHQPSATMNGTMVADFMKDELGFSYKETVAIMGAHSIGGFKFWHSMRKYRWQRGNAFMMNNNYYRIMMGKPAKFLNCGDEPKVPPTAAGKPGGVELAETGWWVRPLRELKSGGPYLWFHYYKRCPTCYKDQNDDWVTVEQRGDSQFQSVECCACNEQTEEEVDPECYQKVAQDETAINTDVGLYYEFEVGTSGIPLNCPGTPASEWNADILADESRDTINGVENGGVNTWDAEPGCPRNDAKDAGDLKSLSDYVEMYADDQNLWANDFVAAFEKLLMNGYASNELVQGPEVLGIGKTVCEQYKVRGQGWNYGCQDASAGDSSGGSSRPRPRPRGGGSSTGKGRQDPY